MALNRPDDRRTSRFPPGNSRVIVSNSNAPEPRSRLCRPNRESAKSVNRNLCRLPTLLGTSRRFLLTLKVAIRTDAKNPVLCLAPMSKKYLTKTELAHELGLTKRGVEELMRRRKIPFFALGHRTVRFVLAEVEKALTQFEHKAVG